MKPSCVARLGLGLGLGFALVLGLASRALLADEEAPEALFREGEKALEEGAYQKAIDDFEALSDQGFVHPDASFDRGLAYLMRLRAKNDKPGDLGRAAAAFEETVRLRPDDVNAPRELDLVRAEVTKRRARRGRDDVDARPTIDRVIVGALGETAWEAMALAASIALATGLVLRRGKGAVHVAGSVLAPAAFVALAVLVPCAAEARFLAEATRPGVVVSPESALLSLDGKAEKGPPIPEAASVETGARAEGLVHVRWGSREGWLPLTSVRLMPR